MCVYIYMHKYTCNRAHPIDIARYFALAFFASQGELALGDVETLVVSCNKAGIGEAWDSPDGCVWNGVYPTGKMGIARMAWTSCVRENWGQPLSNSNMPRRGVQNGQNLPRKSGTFTNKNWEIYTCIYVYIYTCILYIYILIYIIIWYHMIWYLYIYMLPPKKTYFFFTIFTGSHGILLNYFWGIIFRTILRNFWR